MSGVGTQASAGRSRNAVIPAQAGIHAYRSAAVKPVGAPPCVQGGIAALVDPGLRRDDGVRADGLLSARQANQAWHLARAAMTAAPGPVANVGFVGNV